MALADAPEDIQQLAKDWTLYGRVEIEPGETVVVVGAYQGKLMQLFAETSEAGTIYGFEPQAWAYQRAAERLAPYGNRCRIFDYGLGWTSGMFPMGEFMTDAASFLNTGPGSREHGAGVMLAGQAGLQRAGIGQGRIGLMVMNIEGAEFQLLPYFRQRAILGRVHGLAVQWHMDIGGSTREDMDQEIGRLQADGFNLEIDERPSWTYHRRAA